ncbi:hypothetical protein NEDG_01791 [Nematocida displodere]|uniref:ABC transporter domain-containing protein n=1 Tax=Nematocida displodere TaxID=1805483 RepID=A0A177EH66_9MICR|nr:hypothetical protein NEDG_01791 [Nematocida displodere]
MKSSFLAHLKLINYTTRPGQTQTQTSPNTSLELERGKMTALAGPDTESTQALMDTLAGISSKACSTGEVLVAEGGVLLPRNRRTWRGRVSYSSPSPNQHTDLYHNIPLRKLLEYSAVFHQRPASFVGHLTEALGLAKHLPTPYTTLTPTVRGKVLVLLGLLRQKEVYLWHGSLEHLSPEDTAAVLQTMRSTRATTLVTVSHTRDLCLSAFDNLILMDEGEVIYSGRFQDFSIPMPKRLFGGLGLGGEVEVDRDVLLCPSLQPVRGSALGIAFAIWRRSLHFEGYFRGFIYIKHITYTCLALGLLEAVSVAVPDHGPMTLKERLLRGSSAAAFFQNVYSLQNEKLVEIYTALEYLSLVPYTLKVWLFITAVFVALLFTGSVIETDTPRNRAFYLKNLREGEFLPRHLFLAQLLEGWFTKGVVAFVLSVAGLWIALAITHSQSSGFELFSFGMYLGGVVASSASIFLYCMALQFLPVSFKTKSVVVLGVVVLPSLVFWCLAINTIHFHPYLLITNPYNVNGIWGSISGLLGRRPNYIINAVFSGGIIPLCVYLVMLQPPMLVPYIYLYGGAAQKHLINALGINTWMLNHLMIAQIGIYNVSGKVTSDKHILAIVHSTPSKDLCFLTDLGTSRKLFSPFTHYHLVLKTLLLFALPILCLCASVHLRHRSNTI